MENNEEEMEVQEADEPVILAPDNRVNTPIREVVHISEPETDQEAQVIEHSEPVIFRSVQGEENVPIFQKPQANNNNEELLEIGNKRKDPGSDEEADLDSGQSCPICMDLWNNSGEHRLCSLRCGHLFGYSCIQRWLQTGCNAGARRCPQCNHKASAKDIRVLYVKKLSAVDTSEADKLKVELSKVTAEKSRLQMELERYIIRQKLFDQQLAGMKQRILELESQQLQMGKEYQSSLQHSNSQPMLKKFHLERSIDICKDGGCRVLAYNAWYQTLVISQKSTNALFSGYGIKKIDSREFRSRQFVFLHSQAIRDVSFNPYINEILLSVGFDKCAKLMDIHNNTVVHNYQTDSQLWSCCWAGNNHNVFLAGAQDGSVRQFDIRQTAGPISKIDGPGDRSPVVALAKVAPAYDSGIPAGGFIACRLNSCFAYESKDAEFAGKQMFLEGPFVSVCYDSESKHVVVSSRPNPRQPQARHTVCTIEKGTEDIIVCNIVHTFQGGNSQKLLSRPCQIKTENDTLLAAHQEATSSIPIWSISTGKQIYNLPVSDPVIDFCAFNTKNNDLFLATLSQKKLRAYKYGN
ncbi:E3 ubiquitin-protein ligase RFWD3 isoform X1 [Neodiprion pinetum]|uniref:E3 ubiquitin-protein ligase RFWD3 isoform X1 n=2 Tax=Neodiprion pinetum TaxID=441929 RepID=UPI001EE0C32C|nr:E3 ubiquitin-protein ligase RFWD3-like isoform X1 [Neodiprion pinetum]